jgi:hypothetical protein
MNEHVFGNPPADHFCLAVNMIFGGVFHHAGTPMPLVELASISPNLRQEHCIIRHSESAADDDAPASLNYVIGTQYDIDGNGLRRPKHIAREIIDLQLAQQQQKLLEQVLSQSNEQEEAALRIVQEDHESVVARDKAVATFRAKEQDQANELAVAAQQEQDAEISQLSRNVMSPTIGTCRMEIQILLANWLVLKSQSHECASGICEEAVLRKGSSTRSREKAFT